MCPPTTDASWSVQTKPGGSQALVGWKNAVPNRSLPGLERVRDRDDDPLAIDHQVREVMGEEVPDGDGDEPGAGCGNADEPRDDEGRADDQAEERRQQERVLQRGLEAERRHPRLRLGEPVKEDRARPETDEDDIGEGPAALEQPVGEGAGPERAVRLAGDPRQWREQAGRPNQTPKISPCSLQVRRPYWAIITRVNAE